MKTTTVLVRFKKYIESRELRLLLLSATANDFHHDMDDGQRSIRCRRSDGQKTTTVNFLYRATKQMMMPMTMLSVRLMLVVGMVLHVTMFRDDRDMRKF